MGKTIKYGLGAGIVLLFVVTYSFIDKKYPVYDVEIPTEEYVLCDEISNDTEYAQSFVNRGESLKAVSIKCIVNEPESLKELNYALYDEAGNEVRSGKKAINTIKTAKFNEFSFDTIKDCKDEFYTFKLWSEDETAGGVSVYKTTSTNENTKLEQNNSEIEGTMALRTVTHMFDWETFTVVLCFVGYLVIFIRVLYKFFR